MTRPNILLITTDQQRYDTIHAAGFDYMITPNLDRLATEGCIYTNAYSPNPVCLPARHNLITGLSARYHSFDDNYFDDSHQIPYHLPTFAQMLSDNGYDTIAIGKMHFQPYRRHNGFNRLLLMDEIPRFREDDDYAIYLKNNGYDYLQSLHGVRHMLYMQPQQSLVAEKDHGSTWVADNTINYLKTKSKNRPWMIWAGFIQPHPPFDVPASFAHLYDNIPLPSVKVSKTEISTLAKENYNLANYPNIETLNRARQLYMSAISFVDKQVGRIYETLKEIGELDNTLIIFTSDHGEMLGDYGTYQKFLPYDYSSKIPMIIRYPAKIKANTKNDDFVDLNDIFPTFMDVANIKMPDLDYPGRSVFTNEKDRNYQYIEHQHGARRWVSMQNKEYKYNYYYGGAKEELFRKDDESANLFVTDPALAKQISAPLKEKLIAYEKRYGLEGYIVNDDFISFEDFTPIFYRECNPPFFPANLSNEEEKAKLWSLEQELKEAIKNEKVVDIDKLDKAYYQHILDYNKIKG
ncbi:MAG: sulfatase-like hydrolase/transferase [Erysipelotrichaceae bacterium]|nr:sulfatase-like hydrolase/transferase [Erysipelotrichaceae bacterium]